MFCTNLQCDVAIATRLLSGCVASSCRASDAVLKQLFVYILHGLVHIGTLHLIKYLPLLSGGCKPSPKQRMQQLYTAVPDKWRAIGTYLEIPTAQLNSIDKQYHGNPQECLMAMLTEGWLPRISPPPTWQDLAEAVEIVGHPDVALKLRQKFCE